MTTSSGPLAPHKVSGRHGARVAVVVVNWNGAACLEPCLESLLRQTISAEVIVVDNGSTDASTEVLARYSARVLTILNRENLGFAAACNQGIRAAAGPAVAILNNDATADPRWLEELMAAMERHPGAGTFACKVLGHPDSARLDTAGHVVFADGLTRGRGRLQRDEGQYDREEEVFCASGAAALLRREMLDEVGLFDERFFAYCEDADLGFRARHAGWHCIYVPTAVARHRFSGSGESYSEFKAFQVERNRLWLALKNLPLPLLAVSTFFTLLRYVWQAWGAVTGKGAAGQFARTSSRAQLAGTLLRA
jgi:GT2 family glycosyltransferase